MSKRDHAAGASKSLNKTITEIMTFLGDDGDRTGKLRPLLHEKLANLAEKWLKRGFRRGCIEARKEFRKSGSFPDKVVYDGVRELFAGQERQTKLSWKRKAIKAKAKK